MRTLLVLAQHPELAETIRAVLNPEEYRVVHRLNVEEAEPMLAAGLLDACCLDLEVVDAQSHWVIDSLLRRVRRAPVLAFAGAKQLEWEEEAYLKGVAYVLTKPVRGRLLNALLERLWKQDRRAGESRSYLGPAPLSAPPTAVAPAPLPCPAPDISRPAEGLQTPAQALQVLRDFSAILTHSLQAEPMLRQFLLSIREILDVNRAAIFLRRPLVLVSGGPVEESRVLRSACALGLAPGLLEHFQLSFESGIGGYLFREGKILRRDSAEAMRDAEVQKEFELLGAQVAIPMLDRETLVGVAALDNRVTGEALSNGELALIFHLLEELGLAVKNIWLHEQVAANQELLANILRELSSACVVVSRDLRILHANKTARLCFSKPGRRNAELEFSDLPQVLGSKIYQVLQTGAGIVPFKYEPEGSPGRIYQVAIVPLQKQNSAAPSSALLIADDQTQAEQYRRLEVEAGSLRLVRTMAERLAHEINNAIMPVDTYRQLMKKEMKELGPAVKNSEFWNSFSTVMGDSVKRISRRGAQMRILAQDNLVNQQVLQVAPMLQIAFEEAQKHHSATARLNVQSPQPLLMVAGAESALTLAFSEVFLNALQTESKEVKIDVRLQTDTAADGVPWAHIEVQDNGPGFSAEALQNAFKPFYRTKVIGLGLGLTVAQKIISMHEGKVTLGNAPANGGAWVRVSLPMANG